jgi:hypothetical protein
MDISHAIAFVPVILALALSAVLVSVLVLQGSGAYPAGGVEARETPAPITGYAVVPDLQQIEDAVSGPG